jgi:Fungal protein kinase
VAFSSVSISLPLIIVFLPLPLGYEWLYTKPGIFHRDISVNNMMYRKKSGKIFGVLNDYDLAIFKSNDAPSSKTRTGTKPFMAIDLLGNPTDVHRYRHDLESMFYVIVYVISRYHNGEEIDDPPLQGWEELGEVMLKAEKKAFLGDVLPPATLAFENFDIWTEKMRETLSQGRASYTRYQGRLRRAERVAGSISEFDMETMDGHVSFEVFRDIFDLVNEIK